MKTDFVQKNLDLGSRGWDRCICFAASDRTESAHIYPSRKQKLTLEVLGYESLKGLHGRESQKNFVELELPLIVNTQILAVLVVFDASHKLLVHT